MSSGKVRLVANSLKWRIKRRFSGDYKHQLQETRHLGERLASAPLRSEQRFPPHIAELRERYRLASPLVHADHIPLTWFDQGANYGDLLSPWLLGHMTGLPVRFSESHEPHFVMIGSIISEATANSAVWGSGSYGTERRGVFHRKASYHAVRGPLSRSRLLNVGIDCPRVYGDPALLTPIWFDPVVEKRYEVGIVIRHTEDAWRGLSVEPGIRLIDLRTTDVEQTTIEMLECEHLISSSLHGLIIADAYGIPSAWLESDSAMGGSRPFGGEFKFYDYFASVDKMRHAQTLTVPPECLTADYLLGAMEFDPRPISFDAELLLNHCPFLEHV